MRKIVSLLSVSTLLVVCAGVVQSGEDEARAVIAKAIKAAGGEANLTKHKASTWKEKGTYHGGGSPQPYTGVFAVQWPNQFSMEIKMAFTLVMNGDQGWMKSPEGVKEMSKEEMAVHQVGHQAGWIASLLPLKDKAFQLKLLDDAKVDGRVAQVIQVSRKGYPNVKLFFDKTSGILAKSEFRVKAAELKFLEVTSEVFFSDYREVEGAKIPHKIVMKRDGKPFVEAEVIDLRPGKLDATVFARPKE